MWAAWAMVPSTPARMAYLRCQMVVAWAARAAVTASWMGRGRRPSWRPLVEVVHWARAGQARQVAWGNLTRIASWPPLLTTPTRQRRTGGYTPEMFTIDWDHQQVTCPQGVVSATWCEHTATAGNDAIIARFPQTACRACPARGQCTTSRTGRTLGLRPREVHEAVTAARAAQASAQWKARYNIRAGVEGTIAQAAHVTGIRRARYLGLPKTRLEHNAAAAAINLIRLDAWWTGKPLDRTRTTCLQRLNLTPAA